MVDTKDTPQDKPTGNPGRAASAKREVDLFPAVVERLKSPVPPLKLNTPPSNLPQISMFAPVSFDEALDIVDCLRGRAATTICLDKMKKTDASRLVDFVSGASAAIDGDFHKLSEAVYLFCPSNFKITAPGKASSATSKDPAIPPGALDFLFPDRSGGEVPSFRPWSRN